MLLRLSLTLLVLSTAPAFADASCAAVEADAARLACYDAIWRPRPQEAKAMAWMIRREPGAAGSVEVVTETAQEFRGTFGGRVRPQLRLRCAANVTGAGFTFPGFFMSGLGDYRRITLRRDDGPPQEVSLQVGADNAALTWADGPEAIAFIRSLSGVRTLIVSATPFNEKPVTFTLSVNGADEATAPLREACGW